MRAGSLIARYRRLSLHAKFALHAALSIAVLFGILIPGVVYLQTRAVLEQAEQRGLQLAKVFAHSSVQALVGDDFLVMRHVVNSIASEPDVLYATILGPDGRALLHSDMRETGRIYTDPLSARAIQADRPLIQEVRRDRVRAYDFTVPIYVMNDRRAVARVGISIERELAAIRKTRNTILGLGVVALAAGVALAAWQARSVTRPVGELVRGAQEITRGNLAHRIDVGGGDELGQLAAAFNRMTESVRALMETSRELSSTLDADAVLRSVAVHALDLVKADTASLALADRQTREARVKVVLGARTDGLHRIVVTPGRGLGGAVLATGEPMVSENYLEDRRIVHDPLYDTVLREEGIVSAVAVPIVLKGDIVGVLWVANRTSKTFAAEDVDALRRMAQQAAIALENARLYQDLKGSHEDLVTAQVELVQKTRMAAIGEIAAAVAHEARNPLGALSNCVQMLRDNPRLSGEDAELLEIVHTESQRLNEIVSDFLAFGRPRPPHLEDVNVHEVIEATLALLRRDARCAPAIVFTTKFDPALPLIRADRDQLRQVFWNLFLNAVQAMRDQGELRAETGHEGGRAHIIVQDTGPGIPPTARARIFEPFYTTRPAGTGLGLAIVRRIIEEHRGGIGVDDDAAVGTCFTLTLPLDPGAA
ncbi:MAG: ATP-binding protein [Candidatus Rokuibacteriota bacterium]